METSCFALLFADRVITEDNGKKGVIGVFSAFHFPQFPAVAPSWFIYAAFSNLVGKHEFSLNLVRDDAQQVVLPIAGEVDVPAAGNDIELVIPVSNLTFQKPGIHTLTCNIDGYQVASRLLRVGVAEPPKSLQGPGHQ